MVLFEGFNMIFIGDNGENVGYHGDIMGYTLWQFQS